MSIAVDTSGYTAFVNGRPDAVAALRASEVICMPAVVIGELLYGYRKGTRAEDNLARLQNFLAGHRVQVAAIDEAVAEHYGRLRVTQESAGQTIAPNDLWIAATCLRLQLPLLTADSDFRRIDGLRVIGQA